MAAIVVLCILRPVALWAGRARRIHREQVLLGGKLMKTASGAPPVARAAMSAEEPESLSAGVVHRLEVEILKGHRKPGDRLDERQLAEQYTPIRLKAFGTSSSAELWGHSTMPVKDTCIFTLPSSNSL